MLRSQTQLVSIFFTFDYRDNAKIIVINKSIKKNMNNHKINMKNEFNQKLNLNFAPHAFWTKILRLDFGVGNLNSYFVFRRFFFGNC